jgi:hypothetical protein
MVYKVKMLVIFPAWPVVSGKKPDGRIGTVVDFLEDAAFYASVWLFFLRPSRRGIFCVRLAFSAQATMQWYRNVKIICFFAQSCWNLSVLKVLDAETGGI